jgi:hypothetical protein
LAGDNILTLVETMSTSEEDLQNKFDAYEECSGIRIITAKLQSGCCVKNTGNLFRL